MQIYPALTKARVIKVRANASGPGLTLIPLDGIQQINERSPQSGDTPGPLNAIVVFMNGKSVAVCETREEIEAQIGGERPRREKSAPEDEADSSIDYRPEDDD